MKKSLKNVISFIVCATMKCLAFFATNWPNKWKILKKWKNFYSSFETEFYTVPGKSVLFLSSWVNIWNTKKTLQILKLISSFPKRRFFANIKPPINNITNTTTKKSTQVHFGRTFMSLQSIGTFKDVTFLFPKFNKLPNIKARRPGIGTKILKHDVK